MKIIYFLDIPVYRLTKKQYYKELELFIQKKISPATQQFHNENPEYKMQYRFHLHAMFGGAWDYNEIIGYIQLHFCGSQIRGEYWQVNAKRIQRTRKKTFEYSTHKLAPEINIPKDSSNKEIYDLIREYLSDCAKELKKRYIDTHRFETIGPYIDWNSLIADSHNKHSFQQGNDSENEMLLENRF